MFGRPRAEGDQANAVLHVWYGDNDGTGGGGNIIQATGDGKVGIGSDAGWDGTTHPERTLHVFDDSGNSPLRLESVPSGTGTVLVIDGAGDIYSDASIGSDQNVFDNIVLTSTGTGTASGGPIETDATSDTLTLEAGDGIGLAGAAGTDTITITSTATVSPGGAYKNIQFHDGASPAGFAGNDGLSYNDVSGGTGFGIGPEVIIHNMTNGPSNDDRYAGLVFNGEDGSGTKTTSRVSGFHHEFYDAINPNQGAFSIETFNPAVPGLTRAILIDGGTRSLSDGLGYVGIGATDASYQSPKGFSTPARRLHIKEAADDPPTGYSPLRINDLTDGPGHVVLWNSAAQAPNPLYPDEGDVYYVPNGDPGDGLIIKEDGNPHWAPIEGGGNKVEFTTHWVGPANWIPASLQEGVSYGAEAFKFNNAGRGIVVPGVRDQIGIFYLQQCQ